MDGFERDPTNARHKRVRTGRFQFHEWSLDPGDDPDDLELVLAANPASWIDLDELEQRRLSPSMQRWQWQRFTCGLWTAGEDSAISAKEWAACADPAATIPNGAKDVVIGVDLGWRWDTTAMVPLWRAPEYVIVGEPTILVPPRDGTSLDSEDVFAAAVFYVKRYPDCTFVLDPEAGGEQLGQRIERELELEVFEYSQKSPMFGASQRLAEDIAARKLRHPDHDELNRHVLSAAAKFVGSQWRFVKPRGNRAAVIDATVARAMGNDVLARLPPPRRSIYEDRPLLGV